MVHKSGPDVEYWAPVSWQRQLHHHQPGGIVPMQRPKIPWAGTTAPEEVPQDYVVGAKCLALAY
eukprot:6800519-Lingulodinium_polyedra.AAC.1